MGVCVCVCVCERERERESECVCVREIVGVGAHIIKDGEHLSVDEVLHSLHVHLLSSCHTRQHLQHPTTTTVSECVCVCVCVCVRERERERGREREREREREIYFSSRRVSFSVGTPEKVNPTHVSLFSYTESDIAEQNGSGTSTILAWSGATGLSLRYCSSIVTAVNLYRSWR